MDLAGAQHGQHNPVVPFADYARDNIATILEVRPSGTKSRDAKVPVLIRNPGNSAVAEQLAEILDHTVDELAECEHRHLSVQDLLKAESELFTTLKNDLMRHLTREAREYVKLVQNDRTSKAKSITVKSHGLEHMSEEDKARMERKKARRIAGMEAETRRLCDEHGKKGAAFVMPRSSEDTCVKSD